MANILIFGDSIAYGFYDTEGGWVERLKKDLLKYSIENSLENTLKVYNLAISGDTTIEILNRINSEAPPRDWSESGNPWSQETIIIFAVGLNDAIVIGGKQKTPITLFEKNLDKIIKMSRKYSDKILFVGLTPVIEELVTPIPWSETEFLYNNKVKAYDKIIMDFCQENKLQYIELFSKFPENSRSKYLFDGVHPNNKGHELIHLTLRQYLKKIVF
jgi:lysophospholipase L1-like esterase